MSDEVTQVEEVNAEVTPTQEAPAQSTLDPKAIQAEIDRKVTAGIKAYQDNLAKKSQAEKAEQERKAAEERGEYNKLREQDLQEMERLKQTILLKDVTTDLRDIAREAGLLDMDDLALMQADAIASAVDDKGTINREALSKLVSDFKAAKPHKFKGPEQTSNRFGGVPTAPPSPGSPPVHKGKDYYKNEGLDAYSEERRAQLKAAMSPNSRGKTNMDALADALLKRIKP